MLGETVGKKYDIISKLGEGGNGEVYCAKHKSLDYVVAVKVMSTGDKGEKVVRFLNEAKIPVQINHPGVIRVFDNGFSVHDGEKKQYYVMEQLEGTLRDQIGDEQWTFQRTTNLLYDLARALRAIHSHKIVHRDLKPSNIMFFFDRSKNTYRYKIVDFGIAKIIENSSTSSSSNHRMAAVKTTTGMVLGSPPYMAPEQGDRDIDGRADLYSLGCILFEILYNKGWKATQSAGEAMTSSLSGDPTKMEPRLPAIRPQTSIPDTLKKKFDVPTEFEQLIKSLCAEKRDARIPSAEALLERLDEIIEGEASSSTPPPRGPEIEKPVKPSQHRWIWPSLAVVATAMAIVINLCNGGPGLRCDESNQSGCAKLAESTTDPNMRYGLLIIGCQGGDLNLCDRLCDGENQEVHVSLCPQEKPTLAQPSWLDSLRTAAQKCASSPPDEVACKQKETICTNVLSRDSGIQDLSSGQWIDVSTQCGSPMTAIRAALHLREGSGAFEADQLTSDVLKQILCHDSWFRDLPGQQEWKKFNDLCQNSDILIQAARRWRDDVSKRDLKKSSEIFRILCHDSEIVHYPSCIEFGDLLAKKKALDEAIAAYSRACSDGKLPLVS
ncbi:MAG: serine/threonine protein kinase [Proteobacteria bacterium]|nr:serine/threonine protein kinase [Pseudomonadota bacterium]